MKKKYSMREEIDKLVEAGRLTKESGEKLKGIVPGSVVQHRSWDLGIVKETDLFLNKVTIDFLDKPGHSMKISFALKSLESLPENHILSQWIKDRLAMKKLAEEDPETLIGKVLSSTNGKILLHDLEKIIADRFIPSSKFKAWWESTKRLIKKNGSFHIPIRKTEFIEMKKEADAVSKKLCVDFLQVKKTKEKFLLLGDIAKHLDLFKKDQNSLETIINEINKICNTAHNISPSEIFDFILLRNKINKETNKTNIKKTCEELPLSQVIQTHKEYLQKNINDFSITLQRKILKSLPKECPQDWQKIALEIFQNANTKVCTEIYKLFIQNKKDDGFLKTLKENLQNRQITPEIIAWICIERKKLPKDIFTEDFINLLTVYLDQQHLEDTRKGNIIQNTILDDKNLIADLLKDCEYNTVRGFTRKIQQSPALDELSRRSVLARIIKVFPEVQKLVSHKSKKTTEETEPKGLVVSWESLETKKQEYYELVNKKIPENSKEIATARSYGDLRENFEYKAAKEMQTVLMKRKAEIEQELANARGTDFKNPDTSKVTIGTKVDLINEKNNDKCSFTILGAWDSEPEKLIISYSSKIGQKLLNKKVGDKVNIKEESDGKTPKEEYTIKKISTYSP